MLGPGTYRIGAAGRETLLDEFLLAESGSTTIAGLILGAAFFGFGASLGLPSVQADHATEGFFGPNFQASPVPEPATWMLAAIGLAAARRRSRRGGLRT